MVADNSKIDAISAPAEPRAEPTGVLQDRVTAEYPAVNSAGLTRDFAETADLPATLPPYQPFDIQSLESLRGFVSVRVLHPDSRTVVQEAHASSNAEDIGDEQLMLLLGLASSPSFESLGMVTKDYLTLVHAVHSRPGFVCILALEQSAGNLALAKVQIQRVFA